jgi:alpha-1,3-rhamnosyl/mannosyltransferase
MTATLYDVTPLLMPEYHTGAIVTADRQYTERIIKQARGLIAISHNTRNDAIRYLGLLPESITVIYPGVADSFFLATETQATAAATKYRLTRPYVLFVGTLEPRKNIDTLLDAWMALPPAHREEHDLVIAGPIGWARQSTIDRVRNAGAGIRTLGYVPEDSLPGLTKGALALAYPSLYEGFGLPLAQAMAAGVPAITSSTSCLPEVAGDGALTVDPRSQQELGTALDAVLTSPSLRARLAAAGRERAAVYRWDRCARESLDFFRRVAGS